MKAILSLLLFASLLISVSASENTAIFMRVSQSKEIAGTYLIELFILEEATQKTADKIDEALLEEMNRCEPRGGSISGNSDFQSGKETFHKSLQAFLKKPLLLEKKIFLLKPNTQIDFSESQLPLNVIYGNAISNLKFSCAITHDEPENVSVNYSLKLKKATNPEAPKEEIVFQCMEIETQSMQKKGQIESIYFLNYQKPDCQNTGTILGLSIEYYRAENKWAPDIETLLEWGKSKKLPADFDVESFDQIGYQITAQNDLRIEFYKKGQNESVEKLIITKPSFYEKAK